MISREDFVVERWQELSRLKEERKPLLRLLVECTNLLNRVSTGSEPIEKLRQEIKEVTQKVWDQYHINGGEIYNDR